jgi:hypothetical protein
MLALIFIAIAVTAKNIIISMGPIIVDENSGIAVVPSISTLWGIFVCVIVGKV